MWTVSIFFKGITVWPEIFEGSNFRRRPIFKDFAIQFSRMDVPELLHPQYPLGSTSYCTRAAAQILLELAEKVSKRLIDRTCT